MYVYYNTSIPGTELSYHLPPPPPVLMDPNVINDLVDKLHIQKLQAEVALMGSQIQANNNHAFNSRVGAYTQFLAELRQLALAYQIDIEKTIIESEPKFKPLYAGHNRDTIVDAIDKTIMKLRNDLDIK